MSDPSLLRFLELIKKELGARDARVELGGRAPNDPALVWHELEPGFRVVAVMGAEPAETGPLTERLRKLTASFFDVAAGAISHRSPGRMSTNAAMTRLDAALVDLAEEAHAAGAVVIDAQSPVVWGASDRPPELDNVEAAVEAAGKKEGRSGRAAHLMARAIAAVRGDDAAPEGFEESFVCLRDEPSSFAVRRFATIYFLVLAFDGAFSELHAEGAVLHALEHIERLVLAIPPIDTPPGGKTLRLPRLRPV